MWRCEHPEIKPDLTGAHLTDANLGEANLVLADLSHTDLRGAKLARCKLAGARFAGADLTGAELPDWLGKQFDDLKTVKDISSNAQTVFIATLAACVYCWLTIAATNDLALISNRATSTLPIIQTSVPIVGFFFVGPLLLVAAYVYLHFYLQKLWDEIGQLPAVFPDGTPLYRKTSPWLLTDLVLVHSKRLQGRSSIRTSLQTRVSVFLTWWVVPLTLLLFWHRYLDRQEFVGTIFHSVACGVALSAAIFLYGVAGKTLSGAKRRPSSWSDALRFLVIGGAFSCMLAVVAAGAIWGIRSGSIRDSYWPDQAGLRSWVPKAMALYGGSPFVDLRSAELSVKPIGWKASDTDAYENVKGIQLSASSLRYADMRASFLANSFLTSTDLEGADLLGANLRGASMIDSDLRGASLANADLRGAAMARANLEGTEVKYADFAEAQGLTADQLRAADGWCEAFYDQKQIEMLGLPSGNNDQVTLWQQFDANNSSLTKPSTVEAARDAELRQFSVLHTRLPPPPVTNEKVDTQKQQTKGNSTIRSPSDLKKYYDFPTGLDGTGQTIGIIELGGGFLDQNLIRYFKDIGVPPPSSRGFPSEAIKTIPVG